MLVATTVTNHDELEQIYKLNTENLKQNISTEEKNKEGFVTWLYSLQLLQQINSLAPSIIVKDKDKVVGYALVTLKEAAHFHHDLKIMFDNLEPLIYKGKPMPSYNLYCMGQVCIDKAYRCKGVFATLYQYHKEIYESRFDMLITEISTSNIRSQKAHEKVGFKTIHTYHDALDEWNVVVWDWKE
jgi:hypothetical protein